MLFSKNENQTAIGIRSKRCQQDEAMNIAVEYARKRDVQALRARYVPTERNGVISGLFRSLGFEPAGAAEAPALWRLPVASYAPRKTFIRREGGSS